MSIPALVEYVHFNKDIPEYNNVYISNMRDNYVMIYDGPNTTYPVLAGPFSGTNIPPQIISSGCVTIVFISDLNVAAEGFELVWEAEVTQPSTPQISFAPNPTCSLNTVVVNLDQKM